MHVHFEAGLVLPHSYVFNNYLVIPLSQLFTLGVSDLATLFQCPTWGNSTPHLIVSTLLIFFLSHLQLGITTCCILLAAALISTPTQ